MWYCVRVLNSVTSLGDKAVNQNLCDQGTINQFLGNFGYSWMPPSAHHQPLLLPLKNNVIIKCGISSGILMQMEASPDEEDGLTLQIKSYILVILSTLCEADMHRKVPLDFSLDQNLHVLLLFHNVIYVKKNRLLK